MVEWSQTGPDYHEVGDSVDKIDFQKVTAIAKCAYRHLLAAASQM